MIGANTSIHEFLDPRYHVVSSRYMPRALVWYFFAYGWFKYFTTVYRVEVDENGFFRLRSIIKTEIIKFGDVVAINESRIFVNIFHNKGKTSISKLIDGVANISTVIEGACQPHLRTEKINISPKKRILRIICILLLAAYAVYVEVEQIRIHVQ